MTLKPKSLFEQELVKDPLRVWREYQKVGDSAWPAALAERLERRAAAIVDAVYNGREVSGIAVEHLQHALEAVTFARERGEIPALRPAPPGASEAGGLA